MLGDISQGGISDQANLLDVFVMIAHEAKVGGYGAKTVPPGKLRCLNDDTGKIPGLLDVRVNCFRKFNKVAFLERGLRSHIQKECAASSVCSIIS